MNLFLRKQRKEPSAPEAVETDKQGPSASDIQEAPALQAHLAYLQELILWRLEQRLGLKTGKERGLPAFPAIAEADESPFALFVRQQQPVQEELLVLLMALAPYAYASFFDALVARVLPKGGELPEFGGVKGDTHRGMLPTAETALFILAGEDLAERMRLQYWLRHSPFLNTDRIVKLEPVKAGEPPMSGKLVPDDELAEWLLTGAVSIPRMSMNFPAQYIATELDWSDLVLDPRTLAQIREIENWLQHQDALLYDWGLHKKIKPGYRVLFYGPPGTGKTLTAMLLGKYANLPVFRVDLSMVVSKYIGETEKNLSSLFDKAENKKWILFFDEADALFGKRTNVRDAHDKYANQEVSYLLQRVENYAGLVILVSNFRSNMDESFTRRFQSIVYFPMPKPEERLALWQMAFPPQVQIAETIDWGKIASQYELTGSNIVNIVQYCGIKLLASDRALLEYDDLLEGIRREYAKEEKTA